MTGICSGCKWWTKDLNKEWGTCKLTKTNSGETLHETKAAAMDWESYYAILHTAPDFGCVQFQAKEAK